MPPVFLSLRTVRSALLSADGLLGLIPGQAGRVTRGGSDILHRATLILQDEGLDVNVNIQNADGTVTVRIGMI